MRCYDGQLPEGSMATNGKRASFLQPLEAMPVSGLPEGREWTHEVKLDGYRMEAICVDTRFDV
jgi:ATP-dependent DNA ligase